MTEYEVSKLKEELQRAENEKKDLDSVIYDIKGNLSDCDTEFRGMEERKIKKEIRWGGNGKEN